MSDDPQAREYNLLPIIESETDGQRHRRECMEAIRKICPMTPDQARRVMTASFSTALILLNKNSECNEKALS